MTSKQMGTHGHVTLNMRSLDDDLSFHVQSASTFHCLRLLAASHPSSTFATFPDLSRFGHFFPLH